MKSTFSAPSKRTLAFVLVLVLLLTLSPTVTLTANAAYTTGGWEYFGSYTWLEGRFHTDDSDLNFVDDQPYDWKVTIAQNRTTANVTVDATVKDSSGNVVASIAGKPVTAEKGEDSVMLSFSDLTDLTTELYGTFTLVCTVKAGSSKAAQLTKTFKRTSSKTFITAVTSRSNPDTVFTFADPIDLVLNIKKMDGIAAAYNAAITVTNNSDTELLAARGVSLPASTNITLSVKDLVDLPAITTSGTYKVNLTLTDNKGTIHQFSDAFSVVALAGSVTASISSATTPSFAFNNVVPDLALNLQKNDGIAENLNATITVTDSTGNVVSSDTFDTVAPGIGTATLTPDLSDLPNTGTFRMTVVLTDDAGNQRASTSVSFTRTNNVPLTATLIDYNAGNTGNIYGGSDDFNLSLKITHEASAGQYMTVKATGTLNGKPYESKAKKQALSSKGTATVKIDGAMLGGYGFFEDLSVSVYNASGTLLWQSTKTYSFTRVLDTTNPGDLPLLNLNDHFTSGNGEANLKLPLAAQTGANMWRATIPWASVETSKGYFTMPPSVKQVMDLTKSNGMQALIILAYNNTLYGDPNPNDSTWLNAYANYCYEMAKYMKDNYPNQVTYYEIWNEWNAAMGKVPVAYRGGDYYAKVVVAASAAIKSANPNAKVIAGALAGDLTQREWIQNMLSHPGILDAIDGFSFHTYPLEEKSSFWREEYEFTDPANHGYTQRFNLINNMIGEGKEIWLTETGWSTNAKGYVDGTAYTGTTEQKQASYMVQLYAWALAHPSSVDRIFWYDFMNDGTDNTAIEENWGLIRNDEDASPYAAKPSYVAMCALSSKLSGASNGATLSWGDGIYAYQFMKDGNYITIAWTDGTAKTLNATFTGNMVITDIYGNAATYSNSAKLELSETPIYIEYAASAHPSIG